MNRFVAALAAIALGIAGSASSADVTGYTNRTAFDSATAGFVERVVVGFDQQAGGSAANSYQNLAISASGWDSGATTWGDLKVVATNAYDTTTPPNALGEPEDGQFLAGNGDRITFAFSAPVYAFGLYLIGNPSPTGDPAIPFWRLTVNIGRDSVAYSATEPLYSLGQGNDVYFVGIISTDQPFTQAVLYSDNDYAACYSFNVDDMVYASLPDEVSILEAKGMESGPVRVTAVVSRAHDDRFNIQQDDPLAGIAVMGTGTTRGKRVTLLGSVYTNDAQEKTIQLTQILTQTDAEPPGSLGMNTLSVGGASAVGLQVGIPGSVGPNNIGLDATISGRVTAVDTEKGEWITVDDGAGRDLIWGIKGVAVLGAVNASQRYVGQFVTVRGSVSIIELEPGRLGPAIRVAEIGDITP